MPCLESLDNLHTGWMPVPASVPCAVTMRLNGLVLGMHHNLHTFVGIYPVCAHLSLPSVISSHHVTPCLHAYFCVMRQARHPFLDEDVMALLLRAPLSSVANLCIPPGACC